MTRIVNIATLPDRDARIDLQLSNREATVFTIDPKTGLPLEDQYVQTDVVGEPIVTDGEGLPQLGIRNPVSLTSTKVKLKYDRLLISRDTTIGELTTGVRNSVLSDEPFGSLCSIDEVQDDVLLDEIARLKAEIVRLNGLLADQNELNATIEQLRLELSDVTDELELLITTVEELRQCNTTLESAAESRDQAVQELSEDTHRLTLENAYLRSEVLRLGGRLTNVQTGNPVLPGGEDLSGGVVDSYDLTRVRSIAELIISQMDTRTQQNLANDIAVVRNSISRNDVYQSMDLLLAGLPLTLIESANFRGYISELETIFGRGFVYVYGRYDDRN